MNYGFITDYLAEAFHYQFSKVNRYEEVSKRIRLGKAVEGRDEKGIKKMVAAFLKILHPDGPPTDQEFEEYVAYAVEARRRVKEQMNKRKPDDEFALIDLSYVTADGQEIVVYCPESQQAQATQEPTRKSLDGKAATPPVAKSKDAAPAASPSVADAPPEPSAEPTLIEQHFTIFYGETGHSYESIIAPYLRGAKAIVVEDPYIRLPHQIQNFVRFCETMVKHSNVKQVRLTTGYDEFSPPEEIKEKLEELKQSLLELDIVLEIKLDPNKHDREIRIDNGWIIKIGRGLDFYQKPDSWYEIGVNDLSLRRCLETKVDIFRSEFAS